MMNDLPPGPVLVEDRLWLVTRPTGFSQYDFVFEDHFQCRHPYQLDEKICAVARMGAASDYQQRYDELLQWGIELVHTPEQYARTSYLPNWYPLIEEFTPRSVWFDKPSPADILNQFQLPVFLKGERQTNKHSKAQSIIETESQLAQVLEQWQREPILWWQKVVCREFVRLRPAAKTLDGGLPKSYEFRTFWWRDRCVGAGKYWVTAQYQLTDEEYMTIEKIGSEVARRIDVSFLVIDFAQTVDGKWIVIEINDGQDSGYAGVNPRMMWSRVLDILE